MLHFPDFRAHERAFQLMTQVSGRAGRKDKIGQVLIQTSDVNQDILHKIIQNDYAGMYHAEIEDRAYFFYPPFTRLIKITTRHTIRQTSAEAAALLAEKLNVKLGKARVLGPEPPIINKIRNKYLFSILIKLEKENINLKAVKSFIYKQVDDIITSREFRKVDIIIDVDPI